MTPGGSTSAAPKAAVFFWRGLFASPFGPERKLVWCDKGLVGRLVYAAGIAILFGLLAWEEISINRDGGRVAAIWLPNAILVAFALAFRRPLPSLLLPGFAGNLVADILVGDAFPRAVFLAGVNTLEIAVAVRLASRYPIEITRPRHLFRYVMAAATAALLSGFTAAVVLSDFGASMLLFWWQWSMADGLALITVTPLLLILYQSLARTGRITRQAVMRWGLCMGGSLLVFAIIFSQSRIPLLFLAPPVVLFCAMRLGAAGAASSLLLAGVVAATCTVHGGGPIHLIHGDVHLKSQIEQLFLFTTFLSTLPVVLGIENATRLRTQLDRILNSMSEVAFAIDRHGRWSFLNDRWRALQGGAPAQAIGTRALRIIPAAERKWFLSALRGLIAEGQGEFRYRFVATLRPGRPSHLEASIRLIREEDGRISGLGGLLRDRTAEVENERARRESEQQLEVLARMAPVGIFRCDRDGVVTFVNDAWQAITGLSGAEAMGHGWVAAVHPDDMVRVLATWNKVLACGERSEGSFRYLKDDGSVVWVRGVMIGLHDAAGQRSGFIGVVIDDTREWAYRRKIERALAVAGESMKAKERFLANVSHELRTPMNGIIGFADRLLAEPLAPEPHRYAGLIAESGGVMLAMLNEILDMARLSAGHISLSEDRFSPATQLREICGFIEPQAAARKLAFSCRIDPALGRLTIGDRSRFAQIVRNLLSNAVKFTHRGSVSLVAREMREGRGVPRLVVEVSDTGIGIPPSEQAIIFEEFAQGSVETSVRYGGTGLGLAIARSAAEAMGGSLQLVESEVGKGARFRLVLPFRAADAGTAGDGEAEASLAAAGGAALPGEEWPDLAGLHVLVAEDNRVGQELVAEILRALGCRITLVTSGDQAVRQVDAAAGEGDVFDLVLMDLRMPTMGGVEASRQIRLRHPASDLPILAMSANAQARDRQACEAAGMQGHVAKPFTLGSIARAMRGVRGAAPAPAPLVLTPDERRARAEARLERLRPRFEEQCRRCHAMLRSVMAGWPSVSAPAQEELRTLAHNLAGTADLFGAGELARAARALDATMDDGESVPVAECLLDLGHVLERLAQGDDAVARSADGEAEARRA